MSLKDLIPNPYPTYYQWLGGDRIFWSDDFLGGAWVVPRHKDIQELLRDNDRLTSEKAASLVAQFPPQYHDELRSLDEYIAGWLSFIDPPKHIRLRRLLQKGFTPEVLNSFRPRVQQIVDSLIDKVIADGRMDVVKDFSYQLPVQVVGMMLGVPSADYGRFMRWMDQIALFMGSATANVEDGRGAKEALDGLTAYFRTLLPDRRANPGKDLISILVSAEEEGDVLSENELYAQCVFFLFAGHETTSNLICNSMLCLLREPEQMALLRQQPDLMMTMIEETLRYESPFQYTFRLARHDFELFGQPVKKGQILIFPFGAANRDPDVFSNPTKYDITRKKNQQITFGYGLHHCIGSAVARMEAEIAYRSLLDRLTNIQMLDTNPVWHDVFRFRGLQSLPVAFEAVGQPSRVLQEVG